MARILREEMGLGPFPAILHCSRHPRTAFRRHRLGCHVSFSGILTFKEIRRTAFDSSGSAGRSHSGLDRCAGSRARKFRGNATNRPMWRRPRKFWRPRAASASKMRRGSRPKTSSGCSQDAAARRPPRRDDMNFTILGCGSSAGVRASLRLGPVIQHPKNRRRRCSLLVERRDRMVSPRSHRHSPDLREHFSTPRRPSRRHLFTMSTPTTPTASTDLRALAIHQRRRLPVF